MVNKIKAVTVVLILIVFSGCLSVKSVHNPETEIKKKFYDPKIEAESFRFFTAGQSGLDKKSRVYNTSFRDGSVDWMWYELIVRNLSDKDTKIGFREIWYDENNIPIHSEAKEMNVRTKDVYLEYSAGINTDWKPGYYVLKLFQDSLEIAGKEFKITKIK